MAGFHSDLNYLTIHGRSRYAGLHIWGRNSVSLRALHAVQGGFCIAGYHASEGYANERYMARGSASR